MASRARDLANLAKGNLTVDASGDLDVSGTVTSAGINTTGDINFGDNDKAIFGAGSDLQIYHDESHSYVSDAGTGNLQLSTNGTAIKMLRGNGEVLGSFNIGGSVDLYHSNAKKFETTSTGVDVTGNIDFSGGILASNGSVQFVMDKDNNGGEVFVWGHNASNATTNELMRLTSAGDLGIGTASASQKLTVAGSVTANNYFISPSAGTVGTANDTSIEMRTSALAVPGMIFRANGSSQRMQLDAGGKLNVNNTTGSARVNISADNWPENALALYSAGIAGQTNFAGMGFFNQDADSPIGQVADIYTNPTGTLSLTASGNPAIQLKYGSHGISGGTPALTVDNAGRIGIGITAPTEALHVSGNILATGNVTAYSDERLKSDITTIDNALDKVTAMRGVTFTKDGEASSGVIAQEIEKIAPELVMDGDYKSVAYGNLVGYLIEAVKELSAKVEALENGSSK